VVNLVLPIILFSFLYFGNQTVLQPVVGTTVSGEAADLAGILPGDRILKVNGVAVDTYMDVDREIHDKPAQKVIFEIERKVNGKSERQNIAVTTEALPDPNPLNVGEKVGHVGVTAHVKRAKIAVLDKTSPAALAGLKTFDEIVSVNGQTVSSFDELEKLLVSAKMPLSLKVKRGEAEKATTIDVVINAAGQASSFQIDPKVGRFAVIERDLADGKYVEVVAKTQKILQDFGKRNAQLLGLSFVDGVIEKVSDDSAASALSLKVGDRIVAVNGKEVESWYQIMRLFQAEPDAMYVLGVVSEGKARTVALYLKPATQKMSAYEQTPPKILGVTTSMGEAYKQGATTQKYVGFVAAVGQALDSTWSLIKVIAKSLFLLVSFSVPASQMGGPFTIFSVAGEAASHGLADYLVMMSLISVNLGLLNLLPIPVLDGGHLMMFFIEFVTRRPLTLRTRQIATSVGMTFVLMLMALALFNDVMRMML
jgi:regulator of sigma E protease